MAKITVSYDTKDRKLSCAVDGREVADAQEVHFGRYDRDEWGCSVVSWSEDAESGLRRMTHLMASEGGLVPSPEDGVAGDVARYLGGRP